MSLIRKNAKKSLFAIVYLFIKHSSCIRTLSEDYMTIERTKEKLVSHTVQEGLSYHQYFYHTVVKTLFLFSWRPILTSTHRRSGQSMHKLGSSLGFESCVIAPS
jgi:hypothetical protein